MQSGSFPVLSWVKQTCERISDAASIWIEIGAASGTDTICEENDGQLVSFVNEQRGAGEAGMSKGVAVGQIAHKIGSRNHPAQSKCLVRVWPLNRSHMGD